MRAAQWDFVWLTNFNSTFFNHRTLLKNASRSASLPSTLNCVQLVATKQRRQDQVPNRHCVLWPVHQWKLAASKMLLRFHPIRHAEREVVAVVVYKLRTLGNHSEDQNFLLFFWFIFSIVNRCTDYHTPNTRDIWIKFWWIKKSIPNNVFRLFILALFISYDIHFKWKMRIVISIRFLFA